MNRADFLINHFTGSVNIATSEAATIERKQIASSTQEASSLTQVTISFTTIHPIPA